MWTAIKYYVTDYDHHVNWAIVGLGCMLGILLGAAAASVTGCVEDKPSIAARYSDDS